MATRLYFHDKATALGTGDEPVGELSTVTDSYPSTPTGKNTSRYMGIAAGVTEVNAAWAQSNSANTYTLVRLFITDQLQAQTLNSGMVVDVNSAINENNTSANHYLSGFCYVGYNNAGTWTNRSTVMPQTSYTAADTNAKYTRCLTYTTGANISVIAGDRIVFELWADVRNTKATSYTLTHYYDGTTEDACNTTAATSIASYINFSQTLLWLAEKYPRGDYGNPQPPERYQPQQCVRYGDVDTGIEG